MFLMECGTTSDKIIKRLDKTFSMFGYPHELLTDSGPQFTYHQFMTYLKAHNIKYHLITPYWPQANGKVERFNRTTSIKNYCASSEGKDWRGEIDKFYYTIAWHSNRYTTSWYFTSTRQVMTCRRLCDLQSQNINYFQSQKGTQNINLK